ncbi:MAG: hypothetical protein HON90_03190 [Halobacteriovoraceae bacterium]|jgi:hypothetical protein|nr:hypothetical protein [Halobacteriovoraceae bacterium]
MYNYSEIKEKHGRKVSQTIDSPIVVFEYWELSDVFISLFIVLIFGVIFYSWPTMFLLLAFFLGVGPYVKRKNNKGIFLHWPYRRLNMSLPALINPKGKRKYSD